MKRSNKPDTHDYLKVVSKVLPGDHIHYQAPENITADEILEVMDAADAKRERKRLKRINDARRQGKAKGPEVA